MKPITRRTCLTQFALAAAGTLPGVLRPFSALAADGEPQPAASEAESAAMFKIAHDLMEKSRVPGLSIAIARHGQLLCEQGFGFADKSKSDPVTRDHLFRIASISKPITAVAIFSLIEKRRLGLDDLIFGSSGLLKFDYGEKYPERVLKITVRHLLNHTCGGWDNSGEIDPMFYRPELAHKELITWTVHEQPLQFEPGAHYSYSNFGFCLLGRVIEKITGQSYADFVRQNILAKCGVTDMRLGGNTLADRAPGEVVYYGQAGSGTNPYDMNITRMDAHGGWIATPGDLVRFAMHVDGFKTTPSLLAADSIKNMTTASTANPHYACGWNVNAVPNWWHTGSLPGTQTILVRTASGLCWAACANTRAQGLNLDEFMWKMVKAVPAWRA